MEFQGTLLQGTSSKYGKFQLLPLSQLFNGRQITISCQHVISNLCDESLSHRLAFVRPLHWNTEAMSLFQLSQDVAAAIAARGCQLQWLDGSSFDAGRIPLSSVDSPVDFPCHPSLNQEPWIPIWGMPLTRHYSTARPNNHWFYGRIPHGFKDWNKKLLKSNCPYVVRQKSYFCAGLCCLQ